MISEKLRAAFGSFNAGDIAAVERLCGEILQSAPGNADALHLLGMARLMSGRVDDAVALIGRALEAKPDDVPILENLGFAHLVARNHAQGEMTLRRALSLGATNGLTYMRLGMALGSQGRVAESVDMLRLAAEKLPGNPDVQLNLGNALFEAGQMEAAIACFNRAFELRPQYVDAHFNLGTLYMQVGRADDAVAQFQRVLELAPGYAYAHNNLGFVYAGQGRSADAIACFRKALELAPGLVQAYNNLGNAMLLQGQRDEAIKCYEKAQATDPGHPDGFVNLGAVRADEGDLAAAQTLFEKALQLVPADVEAHRGLGRLQLSQGRHAEALAHFQRAFDAKPGNADSCRDLGTVYRELGDSVQAAAWFRKAIAIDPRHVHAHYDLAEVLKLQGWFEEASASYERALAIQADYFPALSGLIYVRQVMCAWDGIETLWERSRRDAIGQAASGVTPFSILSQPTSPEEQLACARAWAAQQSAPLAKQAAELGFDFSRRQLHDKLRIGYLSWDFHAHATSYLIAELFELHDRQRFEIYAYSMGPDDGSAIRERIRGASDHFTDIAGQSQIGAAQTIYGDGIDILVDLKGYTQGARTAIVALRPAPVQMNWLGYPGSMGADFIDYIIADPFVIPAGSERYYSEKVLRLPDCYQINDRRRQIGGPTERESFGLPSRGLVFCCFNATHKILPDVFERWMRILQAVPDSVLWLLEANPWAVTNLRQVAEGRGIVPERLVFAPRLPLAEHLARYRVADLALDTFPYTSHTTGSDALWAGCPLVTYAGSTFASRVAGSLLINAGMPELITGSLDAYEHLAIELARSPARLLELRDRLRANRDTCALFDTPRFVHNLEHAFDTAWADRAGKS